MAPLGVALSAFALLAGAAASSAAAQAPAVAEATTDGAPNLPTLADAALVDPKPADTTSADPRTLADATAATSGASSWYASTADRRALRGCNPKKNTSCCRAPRRNKKHVQVPEETTTRRVLLDALKQSNKRREYRVSAPSTGDGMVREARCLNARGESTRARGYERQTHTRRLVCACVPWLWTDLIKHKNSPVHSSPAPRFTPLSGSFQLFHRALGAAARR